VVGIAPHILKLRTSWRLVVSFTPWQLYPHRKMPLYPMHWKLAENQSKSGCNGVREKITAPARN